MASPSSETPGATLVAPSVTRIGADWTPHRPPDLRYFEAARPLSGLDPGELWAYRDLLFFLVARDIRVRYAQTVVGAGWAIIQPLVTMVVFTIIFGGLAKVPSDGVPYSAFTLTGLVPWAYFSAALANSSASLVANSNLITKVYFPRLIIPLTPVFAGLVDFGIGLGLAILVILAVGIVPSGSALLAVPLLICAMMLVAAGAGIWLSGLNVQYRDVRYVVPFLLQIWMYGSPVVYPVALVPERYQLLYAVNPMVGIIEGFRAALLASSPFPWGSLAISLGTGLLLFLSGAVFFGRTEETFADVA